MQAKQTILTLAAAAFVLTAAGCTYVKLDPAAEEVELLKAERVGDCERLGQTRVSVSENVGFIARGDRAIREDLLILARNSATEMGGDTITRESEIQDGRQTFGVFNCVDDD